ncbi:MAG: hypothetical protein IPP91_06390 [Betaproteobacteria bacterium]|nr:hypothetical protein [Betaproteobacteria bacterium]
MNLDNDEKNAAVCKLHLDLWLHQNTLMWSRLQTLGIVQAGFLALAYSLSKESHLMGYALWACLLCVFTTFGLGIVMWTDRQLRNIHRISIESFGLDLYPASTTKIPFERDRGSSVFEPCFHFSIFAIFISIDLKAAAVLGLSEPWITGFSVVLFLGYVVALAHFYRLERRLRTQDARRGA